MPDRTVEEMKLMVWQLADGVFCPHYESDAYTAKELRLIADELDRRENGKRVSGRR